MHGTSLQWVPIASTKHCGEGEHQGLLGVSCCARQTTHGLCLAALLGRARPGEGPACSPVQSLADVEPVCAVVALPPPGQGVQVAPLPPVLYVPLGHGCGVPFWRMYPGAGTVVAVGGG